MRWLVILEDVLPFFFLTACSNQPEDAIVSRWEPAEVVVAVVIDTMASHRMRSETVPNIEGFFSDNGVWVPQVLATRGLTSVATASLLTGLYPRRHGIRSNAGWSATELPTLITQFNDAGYHTVGLSANACQFIESTDESVCTWSQTYPHDRLTDRDQWLLDALPAALDTRPSDQPLFLWVHLISPHQPYRPVEPYFSELLPDGNTSTIDPGNEALLGDLVLGRQEMSGDDLERIRAAYDSRVRSADESFKSILDALEERGLLSEAVVMLGSDHGESLGSSGDYLFHGCSPNTDVLQVSFGMSAPGRLPAGQTVSGWVSQVELGPTLADVAGIGWRGPRDGDTLADAFISGEAPRRPVYAERSERTATIVDGDWAYVLNPDQDFAGCSPFSEADPYRTASESLFHLSEDPQSANNLITTEPEQAAALKDTLCTWLRDGRWSHQINNPLLKSCR